LYVQLRAVSSKYALSFTIIASKLAPAIDPSSIKASTYSTLSKTAHPTGVGIDPFTLMPRLGANPGKNTSPSDSMT
jgi:hypothetical protein